MEYYGKCSRHTCEIWTENSFIYSICRVEIIRLSDKTFKETIKDVELSVLRSTTKEGYISLDPSKPLPHEYEEGKMTRYNDNSIYIRKYNVVDAENVATSVSPTSDQNENYISLASEYATQFMPETKYHSKINNEWMNSTRYQEMMLRHRNTVDDEITKIEIVHSKWTEVVRYPNETLEKPLSTVENNKLRITPNPVTRDTPEVDKLLNGGKNIIYKFPKTPCIVTHAQTNPRDLPNYAWCVCVRRASIDCGESNHRLSVRTILITIVDHSLFSVCSLAGRELYCWVFAGVWLSAFVVGDTWTSQNSCARCKFRSGQRQMLWRRIESFHIERIPRLWRSPDGIGESAGRTRR